MKKIVYAIALVFSLTIWSNEIQAQSTNTIFTVSTQYLDHMMDSTERAALAAMLQEYHNKVTMKNELVLSERNMWHYWTDDSREFVTVTEYADWSSIEKAGDRADELEKQAWPDAKQRSEFMKKMNGHFTHHKDAIFTGLSKLKK